MRTLENIDRLLEIDQEAAQIKAKQREVAREYISRVIGIFGFSPSELFEGHKEGFRNGAVAKLRELYFSNPQIETADFIEKGLAMGINKKTITTQLYALRNNRTPYQRKRQKA